MITGRARVLSAAVLGLGLLIPIAVVPATAATCSLSAPTTTRVGDPLAIVGSGFPPSSSVDISIALEGVTPDQFSAQSDAAGAFTIRLTPEPADAGRTTVVATAGATCSVQAVFTVTLATATPTPEATPTQSKPSARATSAPPRTEAAPTAARKTSDVLPIGWTLALLILVIGLSGTMLTRRAKGR